MAGYKQILQTLIKLAADNGLAKPYAVGGIVRDRILYGEKEVNDLDITNGTIEALELGHLLNETYPNTLLKIHNNNHVSVHFANLQIDFSNNWRNPFVAQEIEKMGMDSENKLFLETFSRDFTINTMLLDLETNKVLDPSNKGMDDINSRILRTPINAEYILKFNPIRMLRALKLSVQLNFDLDPELMAASRKYSKLLANSSKEQVSRILNEVMQINPELTMHRIQDLGLFEVLTVMGVLDNPFERESAI